jgi:preprotein translocase subunit YajC
MNNDILLTIIQIVFSLIIEGVILSMIFAFIANQTSEKQNKALKAEMSNIEVQNKFIYDQLKTEIENAKTEIISQVKESSKKE